MQVGIHPITKYCLMGSTTSSNPMTMSLATTSYSNLPVQCDYVYVSSCRFCLGHLYLYHLCLVCRLVYLVYGHPVCLGYDLLDVRLVYRLAFLDVCLVYVRLVVFLAYGLLVLHPGYVRLGVPVCPA